MTTRFFADFGNPNPQIPDVLDSDDETDPINIQGRGFLYGHIRMTSANLVGSFFIEMSIDGVNYLPIPDADSTWQVAGGKFVMDEQHRIFQFPNVKGSKAKVRFEHTSGEASLVEIFIDADRSGRP